MIHHPARHHRRLRPILTGACACAAAISIGLLILGCSNTKPPERAAVKIRYPELGKKPDVPEMFKGSIWEVTNRTNDEPYNTASYGLVGRLRGSGDSTASLQVRQWMIKQMVVHGYGSKHLSRQGYDKIAAETVLQHPDYAIVRVDGMIPPGARQGEFFDVRVTALPGNKTTSLSNGVLFEADLAKVRGNSPDMEAVDILAKARGPIAVNPSYAMVDPKSASPQVKASLRSGTIMCGGRVMSDRPIVLRLRHPARPTARGIEMRINQRFQAYADHPRKDVFPISNHVAAALDEGLVEVYVPTKYPGDWEHFMGVVDSLYLNASPDNLIGKAKLLTAEAVKPDAPLMEISYAIEGIGQPALQFALPLLSHPNPDVAFAMARAAVFIPDDSGAAQQVLVRMARDDNNPFQLAAIETLGSLPSSPERNQHVREILEARNTTARNTAYKALVRNHASCVYTRWINDPRDNRPIGTRTEKFALDVIQAGGEPMICATRSGIPRIGLIGPKPTLTLPVHFTTMDNRFMISSNERGRTVNLFFRDPARDEPIKMISRPDIAEIVARLGGEGAPEEEKFDFTYGEIISILQEMAAKHMITATRPDGRIELASFIFEQPRESQDLIEAAPPIERTRPNTDGAADAGAGDKIKANKGG